MFLLFSCSFHHCNRTSSFCSCAQSTNFKVKNIWGGNVSPNLHMVDTLLLMHRNASVNAYFVWCIISVLSGRISFKTATNIHHLSGNCWNGFQGHRSKVKVICVQMCECYNGGGIHFEAHLFPVQYRVVFNHSSVDDWVRLNDPPNTL